LLYAGYAGLLLYLLREPQVKEAFMTQFECTRTLTYRWWRDDKQSINFAHIHALAESADKHMFDMMAKGYTSGELIDNIRMTDDDPPEGVEYSGYWEVVEAPCIANIQSRKAVL
jgi:hypothetical protein